MNVTASLNVQVLEFSMLKQEEIAEFVTDYYLAQHEVAKEVYGGLDREETEKFQMIFKKAMMVSFEVLSKNDGDFFVARDLAENKIVGFTMGMPYYPSVKPLTMEFLETVGSECPSFFQIFRETFPVTTKYQEITDKTLEDVLNGRRLYYLGMTSFSNESAAECLAAAVANHVFSQGKPFAAVYTLSSASHESRMIDIIASQEVENSSLCAIRFGVQSNAPNAFIALVYRDQSPETEKVVKLYSDLNK